MIMTCGVHGKRRPLAHGANYMYGGGASSQGVVNCVTKKKKLGRTRGNGNLAELYE